MQELKASCRWKMEKVKEIINLRNLREELRGLAAGSWLQQVVNLARSI